VSSRPLWEGDAPLTDEEIQALNALHDNGLVEFPAPPPAASEPEGFSPKPLDYRRLIAEGVPEYPHLDRPYIPAGASIWAAGPAGSAKSMLALWESCKLSRSGVRVVYLSQENPLAVELRRLERLSPDPEHLILFHYQGLDLAQPDHVDWLKYEGGGAGLIVVDTFSACWSGDENSNEEIAAFDRDVIRPVIAAHRGLDLDPGPHRAPNRLRPPKGCQRGPRGFQ
jgi:hypothetical protein